MTDKFESLGPQLTALAVDISQQGDGYAASHAARELVSQWLPALSNGAQMIDLLGDVDDVIAQLLAFRVAAAAAADIEIEMPTLEMDDFAESGSDFKLRAEATSCWINVDTIAVHVRRGENGVVAEMFSSASIDASSSALLSFDDAEDVELKELGIDLESVSAWVNQQYQLDFHEASYAQRSLWMRAYHGSPMEPTTPSM